MDGERRALFLLNFIKRDEGHFPALRVLCDCSRRSLCYVPKSVAQRPRRITEKHREAGLVERIGNNEFILVVPRAAQNFQRVRQQFRNSVERLDRASRAPRQVDD